ncbi:MAG TPA: ATP-dependent DNA ligase, partial [Pseudonocardiaceae bacterium]|nr:ATP-dependent DNA ligase [Pseudonocardiaceae bacterium]
MLFSDVVNASATVTATRSRLAKVDALAGVLRDAEPDAEVPAVVGFLVGQPRQGRIGTGWRTLVKLATPPADEPTLTVADVDTALSELATLSGAGSAARRATLLTELLSRATKAEQDFLIRLLAGELRQGALEGVMVDAVARAADLPGDDVRRALMLSGSLTATATAALKHEDLRQFRLAVGRPVRPMLASPAESLADAVD